MRSLRDRTLPSYSTAGNAEICMVGEVEELDSELHVVLLTYHPALGQPEIEVDDAVPSRML